MILSPAAGAIPDRAAASLGRRSRTSDSLPRYNGSVTRNSAPTAPTVGFISLGCPKNLVDSEVMMGLLDRAGARLTSHPEEAEILIVNTCSFIDTAKQESVDTILEMARHKTSGSAKKLIVAGCLVERYRDEIQKSIPEVDAVVGTGELDAILEAAGLATSAAAPSPFNILSGKAAVHAGKESQAGTHRATAKTELNSEEKTEKHPSGAKAHEDVAAFTARLKSCPDTGLNLPSADSIAARNSRAEGDMREQQGRFRRDDRGKAQLTNCPRIFTTKPRRAS